MVETEKTGYLGGRVEQELLDRVTAEMKAKRVTKSWILRQALYDRYGILPRREGDDDGKL